MDFEIRALTDKREDIRNNLEALNFTVYIRNLLTGSNREPNDIELINFKTGEIVFTNLDEANSKNCYDCFLNTTDPVAFHQALTWLTQHLDNGVRRFDAHGVND